MNPEIIRLRNDFASANREATQQDYTTWLECQVVELRRRRDGLIERNNMEVARRRRAESSAGLIEIEAIEELGELLRNAKAMLASLTPPCQEDPFGAPVEDIAAIMPTEAPSTAGPV